MVRLRTEARTLRSSCGRIRCRQLAARRLDRRCPDERSSLLSAALGKFTVLPFNKNPYNWTMNIEEPEVLKAASDKYLNNQTLPPGLTPKPKVPRPAQNVTNKTYFSQTFTSHYAAIAAGRTIFGTVNLRF